MKHIFLLLLTASLWACSSPEGRETLSFNSDWRFTLSDDSLYSRISYADSNWRLLNLPHDWSIEGTFSKDHPASPGGGALPGGIGWYRKTFTLPASDKPVYARIEFDGIYMNSRVYLNGRLVGYRPNGYVSFSYDLTPYLNAPGCPNVLAVRVDNSRQPNSRWYSGSGIYRHVRLVLSDPLHIPYCGTYITTPAVTAEKATVEIRTEICNRDTAVREAVLLTHLLDPQGREVNEQETAITLAPGETREYRQQLEVPQPQLWDTQQPVLYTARSFIRDRQGDVKDSYTTPFGIRTFHFSADSGLVLNGKRMKIKGVCLHHDLGALGAAVNVRAMERQLELLKEMGCNAIRTSHNPPAPEQLDLCDRMGFIVMDETFDIWRKRKSQYDYSLYFDQWHEKDLTDHIRRDRNHPSVFMWSVGNEVLEQWNQSNADELDLQQANLLLNFQKKEKLTSSDTLPANALLARRLVEIAKSADPTRPVTTANNEPALHNNLFRSGAMDMIGYNYHEKDYARVKKHFPGLPFIATETTSALMTRGFYQMPSDSMYIQPKEWWIPFETEHYSCSSYDNCHVPWGTTHEKTWQLVRDNDFISGLFVWTGFDYLGEPTPYWWPARSSYFGILDLAGFPKDIYYMYQSEWTDTPVLHIFPHWNWHEGDTVDIWAYYNRADSVELFLNGRSLGCRTKTPECLHAVWRLAYRPGTLTAVSYRQGEKFLQKEIHTAGPAARIRLTPDRSTITADGRDLCFVTVEVTDADGYLVPDAAHDITFSVEGPATIAGVDNGSPLSHEPFKSNRRKAFYGKCLLILQSATQAGPTVLTATSPGLETQKIQITSKTSAD